MDLPDDVKDEVAMSQFVLSVNYIGEDLSQEIEKGQRRSTMFIPRGKNTLYSAFESILIRCFAKYKSVLPRPFNRTPGKNMPSCLEEQRFV